MNNIDTVKKDKVLIILSIILGVLYFMTTFFYCHGIGTFIFFMCYYGIIFYAGKGNENFSAKKGKVYFIPEIILLCCFLIYDNNILNFFNVPIMIILLTLHTAVMFSQNDIENPVILFLKSFFQRPLENSDKIFKVAKEKTDKKNQSVMAGLLIGILLGIPIFTFVTVLLSSADKKFGSIFTSIINAMDLNIIRMIVNTIFGIVLSIAIFGGFYYNRHNTEKSQKRKGKPFLINPVIGITVLFMISISYIIYLALQFEYLFSAMAGKLPNTFIYSEYARNGFFELFVIALLNFVLVTFFLSTGKSNIMKIASCGVSVITLLLIISSLSKMILYITKYDLTRLRVYTTWFMVTLFIVFVVIIIKIFNEKIKLLNICLIVFTVMYLILNISNTDGIIGKYNTENYINSNRKKLDVEYISKLSDNGVIYLTKIAEGNFEESLQAKNNLELRKYFINNKKDWQGFNISTMILKSKLKNYNEKELKSSQTEMEAKNTYFKIHILNKANQVFSQIECEKHKEFNNIGTESIVSGTEVGFKTNEDIVFEFYEVDEDTELMFYIILDSGERIKCSPVIKEKWVDGADYIYILDGNENDGFTLSN